MDNFYDNNEKMIPDIDPKDPFNNFTENKEYNSNYAEIVPQIDIHGCVIPFEPSSAEKRKIRHYFNIAGAGIFIHLVATMGISMILSAIIRKMVMKTDGVTRSGLTVQYLNGLTDFLNNSSISTGLNMLIFSFCSILVFLIGSKLSGIKLGVYFQTTGLTLKNISGYCMITFFIRIVGGLLFQVYSMLFPGADLEVGNQLLSNQYPKAVLLGAIYACILAPVTEELLCRGFILKNLSRVSQRFGIFMSALFFALMHGNINQFIFAFLLGIFLAQIDIKHNSIIPSIIVHSFANTFSVVVTYSGLLNNMLTVYIVSFIMLAMGIAGALIFKIFHKNNRLPYSMPHQKLRNGTAVSSVMLVISVAVYTLITVLNSFPEVADSFMKFLK